MRSFLQTLPEGEDAYVFALRKMLLDLYGSALATTQARFFSDKTPRYFMIIPELGRVFPKARYLILFRNPLAALGSILNMWVQGEWLGVAHARPDLVEAPRLPLEGRALLGERAMTVQYERLVREPERTMQAICRYVDLDFDPALVEYNCSDLIRWPHSDQKSVYRYTRPEPVQAEKWVESLHHPQVWRLSHDYLHALGGEIIQEMGYDFDELSRLVDAYAPSGPGRWLTFSLNWLARRPPAVRPWRERRLVWLVRRLHRVAEN